MTIKYPFAVLGTLWLTLAVSAQDNPAPETAKADKPSRSELRDKQLDVSLEARDIERILTKLKRASDLSKQRIAEAAIASEDVSSALDRGDSPAARKSADQTAAMFAEISRQLEALLAEETPQRVAAARNLAAQLARTERQFAQQIQGALNPTQATGGGKVDPKSQVKPMPSPNASGGGQKPETKTEPQPGEQGDQPSDPDKPTGDDPQTGAGKTKASTEKKTEQGGGNDSQDQPADPKAQSGAGSEKPREEGDREKLSGAGNGKQRPMTDEEQRDALAQRAAELAEKGETLLDILQAIAASTEPADQESVAKINALLKETKLAEAVAAMKEAAAQVQSQKLEDAKLSALDIADRMEIAAQRLDAAYRASVAPQAEELRKLEQDLARLGLKLEDLETRAQVVGWSREARELLDRAEQLGISDTAREELLKELEKSGLGIGGDINRLNWTLTDGRYVAPAALAHHLVELQEDVQLRIQGLVLDDIVSAADEATPPKYQGLVERYYQVLSGGTGDPSAKAIRKPPTSTKQKP